MDKHSVDYALYLVTDSTPAILGDRDLCEVVEAALRGGVTCVQYREKKADTGDMIATARRLHELTRRFQVPLLINDRVDVALAIGCEGVHIGQDDIDLATARKLLGPDAIIGVTVCNVDEVHKAATGGADYLGIGTVFSTATKDNTKSIIGVDGLQQLLGYLRTSNSKVKTVCIGGINASNTARVMWQSASQDRKLDGIAVVSAIVAAEDPAAASRELLALVRDANPPFARHAGVTSAALAGRSVEELVRNAVPEAVRRVHEHRPLSHNMTNLVVQNIAANVALAVGASPIMANYAEEARDLAALGGALVINMGTVTPEGLANYQKALRAYNDAGQPVVYDPVGAGATAVRRAATKTILNAGYIDVIKGNRAEILACTPTGSQTQQRGVDSGDAETDEAEADVRALAATVRDLATQRHGVVVATGRTDLVAAAGARGVVLAVANGHPYLGAVTGTGCCLGTAISAMVAASPEDKLGATLAALLLYEIAAEVAAARPDVRGPGTFVPAFLDELYNLRVATAAGDLAWLDRAKVSAVAL